MLFVFGQDAQKFTQPWDSSFHSLVPHLWDKGSGKEEERKVSRGPGVTGTGDRGNHRLLLVAVDLVAVGLVRLAPVQGGTNPAALWEAPKLASA